MYMTARVSGRHATDREEQFSGVGYFCHFALYFIASVSDIWTPHFYGFSRPTFIEVLGRIDARDFSCMSILTLSWEEWGKWGASCFELLNPLFISLPTPDGGGARWGGSG